MGKKNKSNLGNALMRSKKAPGSFGGSMVSNREVFVLTPNNT